MEYCDLQKKPKYYTELLPFISEMYAENKEVTSEIIPLDGKECIAFLSPAPNIELNGKKIIGVASIISSEKLNESLSLTLFKNKGYGQIVSKSGNIIVRSTNTDNQFKGYNLFAYLKKMAIKNDTSIDEIKEDFANNQTGTIEYVRSDGEQMMAIYSAVGYSDWYLYTVIPSSILTAKSMAFYRLTLYACLILSIIFLFLLITIFTTQAKRKKELLEMLYTDHVTDGISISKFNIDTKQVLSHSKEKYVVIYINIYKFKWFNEQVGRNEADQLLKNIYWIIQNSLSNNEFISRVMADHFGVLLKMDSLDKIKEKLNAWNEEVSLYIARNKFPSKAILTYGMCYVNDESDVSTLLDKANMARKTIRNASSSSLNLAIYDDLLEKQMVYEKYLEDSQEAALLNQEFEMYIQPKYSPYDNTIAGGEALVRWVNNGKVIYQDQFIPLFENNGFITQVDLCVFKQACQFVQTLKDQGMELIPISINLSRVHFNNPHFLDDYIHIFEQYDFPQCYLEFEITENIIFDHVDFLNQIIEEIHAYGFKVSMDDFGSGYSSLNVLKQIDVDGIKLDRQFFQDASQTMKAVKIVRHIIQLAKDLGMVVVSEGVEHKEQVDFLRDESCDLIQGYYYSKPVPKEVFLKMLKKNKRYH
ncbi:MAG: GGDEF domain-containing protein [Erysipelotrichia bacterium]|nr:GGDEF domain-containing protein [Erysipelotrichia bacterium]